MEYYIGLNKNSDTDYNVSILLYTSELSMSQKDKQI